MPVMLDKDTYADEYKLLAKCCKFSFWSFCETFWDEIPGTGELIENWHMKYLCDVLQETAERIFRGETKKHDVLINVSPGTSKSSLGSILYPAWIWSRMPEARIITASHTDDLVLDLSNKSRFVIKSDLYQACFPEVQIRDDQDTKGYYANSAGGDRKTCTVGGKSPMGFHAHFCFPYETKITTKLGQIPIGEIVENKLIVDVLSYNVHENQFEWKPILTHMHSPGKEMIRFHFSNGNSFSCTEDHPVYVVGKGFIPASSITTGEKVIHARFLSELQKRNSKTAKRFAAIQDRLDLLQSFMPSFLHARGEAFSIYMHNQKVCKLSKKNQGSKKKNKNSNILFSGMLLGIYPKNTKTKRRKIRRLLSYLWKRQGCYKKIKRFKNDMLFSGMCQQTTFQANERQEQFQLCPRKSKCSLSHDLYQKEKEIHSLSRKVSMLPLCHNTKGTWEKVGRSSCGLRQNKLQKNQSGSSLSKMSWEDAWENSKSFEKSEEVISFIEREVSIPSTVYNLEIAENNNYFAENILVHNCIVDDPLDPKRAVSETELKSASYFYDSVIPSRKVNKEVSVEITIMQRLHLNDPSGHILERSKKDKTSKIFHISLPAELHEEGGKYSPENVIPVELAKNYKNGLMDPKRLSRNVLERERATMGIYSYSSQFLQNPIPLSGGMFHDHYFSQRVKAAPYACKRIRYWDRASSVDKGACNTAGTLMARDKDGNFYVEHVVVGKWEPKERNQKMRATALRDRAKYGKYEPVIWVEAEGGSAGRDAWKGIMRDLSGFVVKEDRVSGSKETRAEPWSAQLAGNAVWLVEDGTWDLNEYIQEHCHFPFGKLKDRVDSSCLVAGTSVTTKIGDKPIEEVIVGDFVLTRKGFQKVLWSGKTKEVNFLVSVDFGNDIRVTGTPEHLIWTEDRGFCRLDSLSATSRILYKEKTSCQNLKSLSILTESNSQKEEITIGERGENYHCIEQHGNSIMEKFPRSMTYIIKMETEIIILSKTLNVCQKKNTCNDTLIVIKHQNNVNICNEFVNWLLNGINQKKEESGIRKTASNVSKNENTKNTNVLFAILNLNPSVMGGSLQKQREIDSVLNFVMSDIDTLQEKGLLTKNALCAVNRIREIEEGKPVPENVADYGVGRVPVYDLTVENEPEFFANGVLVHNSGAFNRLVGSPMVYPTLRTYTFSHNIKKNKNPRILVCSKDYLQNTIIDNSHRCLLVLLHEPEPVGNISDIPLHAIANLEGQIALQFSSHDPALHQDNWEELIAPFDRPVSDLMMFPSHGKSLWSFLLKKRQNIPDMWVFCDMQEKRKDISIALGILDLLRWDKGTSLECEYEEYQKNEHVYDIIKNSRNSVI